MLRGEERALMVSRLLDGLSGSSPVLELSMLPIAERGAETERRPVLWDFELGGVRLLVVEDLRSMFLGPVESISDIEKERLWEVGALCIGWVLPVSGEEAAAGGELKVVASATSNESTLALSSISTCDCFTLSRAETSMGVYFLSGYTRLIGLGMPVE